jgi:hypothetical protein
VVVPQSAIPSPTGREYAATISTVHHILSRSGGVFWFDGFQVQNYAAESTSLPSCIASPQSMQVGIQCNTHASLSAKALQKVREPGA